MPRRRKAAHRGGSVMDKLKSAHGFVKSNQLISKVLLPLNPLASQVVGAIGYGQRHQKRGGFWGSIGSFLGNVTKPVVYGGIGALTGVHQGLSQIGKGRGGAGGATYPAMGAPTIHNVAMAKN